MSQARLDRSVDGGADCYAATMRAPFAMLGIRTDGETLTTVAYLPNGVPERAPSDRIAAQTLREIERYLDDPAFRFTVPMRPGGTAFQSPWGENFRLQERSRAFIHQTQPTDLRAVADAHPFGGVDLPDLMRSGGPRIA